MDLDIYNHLNKQWKSTYKILLGQEADELIEHKDWLCRGNGPRLLKKSSISGKEIVYSSDKYSDNSKWIGHDEVGGKFEPLNMNEIKDIDSIIEAVRERITYSGSVVLGNSKFVKGSTTISDCFYILDSERVAFSKNVAYSTRGGYSENIFGCYGFGPVTFAIKSYGITESTRIFLTSKADFSSDIYYSHGISNCMECIFSFNIRSKRYAIGNLVLPKEKYALLKKKLLAEIAEKLKKEKTLPSIAELIKHEGNPIELIDLVGTTSKTEKEDKQRIEKAFKQTTEVLIGKPLNGIDKYATWMKRESSVLLKPANSCISGEPITLPDYAGFIDYPDQRLLTQEEAYRAGEKLAIIEGEAHKLSIENASVILSKIAYFCPFWFAGKLENNIDSPLNIDSRDCYSGILYIRSKLCAFSFSPRSCEYCFGSREGRHVSFSINSHFSMRVTRCFEVDHCSDCSDCYFCHNCENVQDSMFCFNVKNLRNAIGNTPVDRGLYQQTKTNLREWLAEKLEQKNKVDSTIFSL
ncbi:MAG: hypothetical protein ABH842_02590 [Candidatus Micrarchaeota archaeon]